MGIQLKLDKELYPEQKLLLATPKSYCFDLRARETVWVGAGEVVRVPLGVWIQSTTAYTVEALKLYVRSGLASHYGLMLANGVGIVDEDFSEEIHALITRQPSHDGFYIIRRGDRIVQGEFATRLEFPSVVLTDERVGGYGSTGK